MFAQHQNTSHPGFSFGDVPSLVNSQYQYKSLGEMVAMYKQTGEFPAVGMRNGVYFAKSIDDPYPIPSNDKFAIADAEREAMSKISDLEKDISEYKRKSDEELAKSKQSPTVPPE